jgi:ArsR family transcriptional regulator
MIETEALSMLSALAQPTRLGVITLLARVGDHGMASSEIADAIGVPRHLMSAHLAVLSKGGVVTARKAGRNVTYSVRTEAIVRLTDHLKDLVGTHASADPPA